MSETRKFSALCFSLPTSVGFGRWRSREWGGRGKKRTGTSGHEKRKKKEWGKKKRKQLFFCCVHIRVAFFSAFQKKCVAFLSFPSLSFSRRAEAEKKFIILRLCPPSLRPAKQTDGRLFSLLFLCRGFGKQGYQCQGKLSQKSHQKTTLLNLSGENDLHFLAPVCQQNLLFDSSLQLCRPQAMPRVRHLRLSRGGPRRRLRREYTHTYTERRIRDDNYNPYCEGTSAEGASAVFRGGQWRSLSIRPRRILLRLVPKGEEADKSNLSALSPPFPRKQWMFAAAYLGAMVHHPPLLERSSLAQVAADARNIGRPVPVPFKGKSFRTIERGDCEEGDLC